MGERYKINSEKTLNNFIEIVRDLQKKHGTIVFDMPEIGGVRASEHNSVYHVWMRKYCACLAKCPVQMVTESMLLGLKRSLKRFFWLETKERWIIEQVKCPLTGDHKVDFKSSSRWTRPQMTQFMQWMQGFAAEQSSFIIDLEY